MANSPLRIGFVGSGFIAQFHLKSFTGVRNSQIAGVFSPTADKREAFAQSVNDHGLGPCEAHGTLRALLASDIDAVWVLSPNYARLETFELIAEMVAAGTSRIKAVACEKPLGRTLGEAKRVLELTEQAGLLHGYLENQLFSTAVKRGRDIIWRRAVPATGRPYLARAAEEHAGPHEPWFWNGEYQGGGVMSDMMCHSIEVGRYLLTAPDEPRNALTLKSVSGTIAFLKWTQDRYASRLARNDARLDYRNRPSEDFARALITYEDPDGREVIVEATTSWAYVGAGLRIVLEMMGPEYSMQFSSLSTGLNIFMSREVEGSEGEDLVEKQNAEQGLMPVVDDEAGLYGYTLENRHMVEHFAAGLMPDETFADGVDVSRIIMALYKSAEEGRVIKVSEMDDLDNYVAPTARPA